jgi:hypothetical protein
VYPQYVNSKITPTGCLSLIKFQISVPVIGSNIDLFILSLSKGNGTYRGRKLYEITCLYPRYSSHKYIIHENASTAKSMLFSNISIVTLKLHDRKYSGDDNHNAVNRTRIAPHLREWDTGRLLVGIYAFYLV